MNRFYHYFNDNDVLQLFIIHAKRSVLFTFHAFWPWISYYAFAGRIATENYFPETLIYIRNTSETFIYRDYLTWDILYYTACTAHLFGSSMTGESVAMKKVQLYQISFL